jgi:hypothetical protein
MHTNARRFAVLAAVSAASALAPVASAGAATVPGYAAPSYRFALPQFPAAALPAFNPGSLSFVGPSVGGLSAVIGPTVITVGAGNIFTNTTITTSGGDSVVGAP